uniref:tRNA (guanine(10)-N(2))-methyltransferase n=1 Tax=Globisporangium ultimum (strain ATCC 200006 / CBS 805.95 / DAOM BR144) TaxID=431595 RepID=K3WXR5_GLOUD
MPEFLVFFVHRHFDFRYPELEAVLTLQQLQFKDVVGDAAQLPNPESSPLLRIQLPSVQHAKFLSERGILVKGVYEVWGHTKSGEYEALVQSVAAYGNPLKQQIIDDENCSWRINVDAFGKKLSMTEQRARREHFRDVLPFKGPVMMKDSNETFLILEEIGVDQDLHPELKPKQIFFLREIAGSDKNRGRGGARDLVDQQTLKRRAYIGPTSMESEMALLMSNMALVQQNDLVIDPFVGTGSVLIPCGTHGAICFGTDIDIRVLLGTGVGVTGGGASEELITEKDGQPRVNVMTNFKQYGLPLPELLRADNSLSPIMEKCRGYFDAVVCDPPYGIRAGARKSGRKPSSKSQEQEDAIAQQDKFNEKRKHNYIPPTQPYAAEDVMSDLLNFAAETLREGGRLVYLLPTTYEYTDNDLPRHPKLHVIANSEQKLTMKYARRLITMVKRSNGQDDESGCTPAAGGAIGEASYSKLREKISHNYVGGDASFANLREKILEQNRKRKSEELLQAGAEEDGEQAASK